MTLIIWKYQDEDEIILDRKNKLGEGKGRFATAGKFKYPRKASAPKTADPRWLHRRDRFSRR